MYTLYIKMSYKNEICDYVTLWVFHAEHDTNTNSYIWKINPSYFSNQRSSVCSVSLASCVIVKNAGTAETAVDYVTGGQNVVNSGGIACNLLATLRQSSPTSAKYFLDLPSPVEIFTTARPDVITLRFRNLSNANPEAIVRGCITLKYTYYNAEQTAQNLLSQYTPVLK